MGLPPLTTNTQVGGHEGIGNIVKFGPGCESAGLKLGDRVGIKWVAEACLSCPRCLTGTEALCTKQKNSGYSCPGTFQEYVLSPAYYVTRIPEGLDSAMAAPLLCGGVTVYSALKKCCAQPGDWVAMSGAGGGLGHLGLQIGKAMGFRMLGLDIPEKEEFIFECGAEKFVDVKGNVPKDVLSATDNEGVAAVVICNSSNDAYATGLKLLKFNGTLVCVGVPNGIPVPIASTYPAAIIFKQLHIVGSAVGGRQDANEVLALANRGLVKTHFSLHSKEELGKLFEEMEAGRVKGRYVLDMSR